MDALYEILVQLTLWLLRKNIFKYIYGKLIWVTLVKMSSLT